LPANVIETAQQAQGLEYQGTTLRIFCADWAAVETQVCPLPATAADSLRRQDPATAVYRLSRKGDWSLQGPCLPRGSGLGFELESAGIYAVFVDRSRPYLGPGPFEGRVDTSAAVDYPGLSAARWQIVEIGMEDRGSGIDAATLQVRLNGEWLAAEPDLPRHRVLVGLPDALPAGAHRLDVEVSDRAGNVTARGYDLQLVQ
jgi:hypothetical protein